MNHVEPTEPDARRKTSTGQWAVEKVAEVVAGGDQADNERLKLFLTAAAAVFALLGLLNLAQLGIIIALLGGAFEGELGGNKVKVRGAPAANEAADTDGGDGSGDAYKDDTGLVQAVAP